MPKPPLPIAFTRTYIANDSRSRSFGIGATDFYDMLMVGDINPWTYQELVLPDGARIRFDRVTPGFSFSDNPIYVHTSSRGPFYGGRITRNSNSVGWTLTLKDGTKTISLKQWGRPTHFVRQSLASQIDMATISPWIDLLAQLVP
jgi:hypothetical protein